MRIAIVLGCFLLVGATACAEAEDKPAGPTAEWEQQRARVVCERELSCCGADGAIGSQSDCQAGEVLWFSAEADRLRNAVSRGVTRYDETRAEACVAELGAMSCAQWVQVVRGFFPDSCLGIATGSLPNGAACRSNYDCASAHCDLGTAADDAAGTCATKGGAGQPCDEFVPAACESGLRCWTQSVCATPRAAGESCSINGDCYSVDCDDATGLCGPECILRGWGHKYK